MHGATLKTGDEISRNKIMYVRTTAMFFTHEIFVQ